MIPYIIHVTILLSVSYIFFLIFLQRETFFALNRWILLACVTLSFVLPMFEMPQEWSFRQAETVAVVENLPLKAIDSQNQNLEENTIINTTEITIPTETTTSTASGILTQFTWQQLLLYLYYLGIGIFLINFFVQLVLLFYHAYRLPSIKDGRYRIIELNEDKAPYSFWNNIFINPSKYDWDTYNQIIEHEKIHVKQRHTLDILLSELVVVLQWFNPFAWWYRKVVENNLEYLTDNQMLLKGTNKEMYQMNLLKISAPDFPLNITTNYNQSFLKKRIVMMETKKSSARSSWKYLFLIPLFGLSLMSLNQVQPETTPKTGAKITQGIPINTALILPSQGNWQGTIKGDAVCLEFYDKTEKKRYNWRISECFTKSEFSALPTTQQDFNITREAGTLKLNGKFSGEEGSGTYVFDASSEFRAYLEQFQDGDDKRLDHEVIFQFFMADMNKAYVEYLKASGYSDLKFDDLAGLAVHDVKQADFKKMSSDLKAIGYKDVAIHEITMLVIHDVSMDYIQNLGEEVKKDLTLEDVVKAKIHDVKPKYIKEFKAAGFKDIDFEKVVQFSIHDVDVKYIQALKAAGLDLNSEQIVQAAIHDIKLEQLQAFKAAGYDMDFETFIQFAIHNIDMEYIQNLKKAGLNDLSMEEIIQAAIHDLKPEMIKQLKAKHGEMDFETMIQFAIHNINDNYVDELKAAGLSNLTTEQIIQSGIHGLKPERIKKMMAANPDMKFETIIQFAIHDISDNYVNELKAAGLGDLTTNQMIQAAIHDVKPEYIKKMKAAGYADDFETMIQFAIHEVDLKYIENLKQAGLTDLTSSQIMQAAIHNVNAQFIKDADKLGFKNLKFNELIKMAIHDVNANQVKALRDIGYPDLKVHEVIQAAIHDVDAEFVKGLNDLGFKDIPIQKLIELRIHDVDADYIKETQAKGKKGLTLDDYKALKIMGEDSK